MVVPASLVRPTDTPRPLHVRPPVPHPLEVPTAMSATPTTFDVTLDRFEADVLARSHETPVVVDFWAAWCGPCRTLGPILEEAVDARGGEVVLAKVDVDAHPALAQRYRVQGIPAVKAFRDGELVAEFTGALPRSGVESFLDQVVPTAADRLASEAADLAPHDRAGAEARYRDALAADPGHRRAALGLADLVVTDDPAAALELVRPHRPDPAAEAIATRAELAQGGDADEAALLDRLEADPDDAGARVRLARSLAAGGEYAGAIDHLLTAVRAGGDGREPAREQLLALFGVLGDDHDLVRAARPRLASALF